ncbi:21166_t:CDS:2, partial [Cetraspora pellucida]
LVARNVLNVNNPVINVHISADSHYTIILYLGGENYEMLQKVMESMISELHNLITNGLDSNGIKWKIKLYFSSDWKFMAIMLGFNAPNATYFYKMYKIEKNMNQLKSEFFNNRTSQTLNLPLPGHLKVSLLPMISLNHYVPDELHIMLRIWNRLWELVIQELKSENRFDNHVRAIINIEMQRISVGFHFWQDYAQSWHYTSLMGDDKEKVLCDFNFVIFDEE